MSSARGVELNRRTDAGALKKASGGLKKMDGGLNKFQIAAKVQGEARQGEWSGRSQAMTRLSLIHARREDRSVRFFGAKLMARFVTRPGEKGLG